MHIVRRSVSVLSGHFSTVAIVGSSPVTHLRRTVYDNVAKEKNAEPTVDDFFADLPRSTNPTELPEDFKQAARVASEKAENANRKLVLGLTAVTMGIAIYLVRPIVAEDGIFPRRSRREYALYGEAENHGVKHERGW